MGRPCCNRRTEPSQPTSPHPLSPPLRIALLSLAPPSNPSTFIILFIPSTKPCTLHKKPPAPCPLPPAHRQTSSNHTCHSRSYTCHGSTCHTTTEINKTPINAIDTRASSRRNCFTRGLLPPLNLGLPPFTCPHRVKNAKSSHPLCFPRPVKISSTRSYRKTIATAFTTIAALDLPHTVSLLTTKNPHAVGAGRSSTNGLQFPSRRLYTSHLPGHLCRNLCNSTHFIILVPPSSYFSSPIPIKFALLYSEGYD